MEAENEELPVDYVIKSRLHQIIRRINEHTIEAEAYCKDGSDIPEAVYKAQICASKLENMIKRFTTELNEYFRISNNTSPDEISEMSNAQLNGEEILVEIKCKLSAVVNKDTKRNQSDTEKSRVFAAKLPTLTLPEFHGDVLTWCEFWDIYKSNIHDRSIADVDKLLYLKSALKGEPRRIVDGLETTNKNYAIAVQILTDRYGKQSEIIDAHYSALNKVKAAESSISDCRTTLNEFERHLRVLQSLGEDSNHNHIRYLIKEKFPGDIIYEMKMKMKENTVQQMREQLELIISGREEANTNKVRQDSTPTEKENHTVETLHTIHSDKTMRDKKMKTLENRQEDQKDKHPRRLEPNYSRHRGDTSRKRKYEPMRVKDEEQEDNKKYVYDKKNKPSCVFCKKNHYSDRCQEYKTLEERKVKLNNRCFNCFSDRHFASSCETNTECYYCHKSGIHHRALCPEKFNKRQN